MIKYLWNDLVSVLHYLPYGVIAGTVFALLIGCCTWKKKKRAAGMWSLVSFIMYLVIIMCITFWSRESGSRTGIDLELFSTWGINARNNAYVVENVLLFIPYGIVCAWAFPVLRKFLPCAMIGLSTSMMIEYLQLVTKRGFFQVDDILTNLLGSIIGYLLFKLFYRKRKH